MKKNIIILISIAISFLSQAQNSDLNQLINGILANSSNLKSQKSLLKIGELKTQIQESFAKPIIGADAGITRIDPVAKANFNGMSLQFQPNMNYSTGFSANHVLYDWGKNALAIEKTRLETALTQAQIETQEANLAYQIAQLYYQFQLLNKSLLVQKKQQLKLEEQLSVIENSVKSGVNLEYDLVVQKVRNQNHAVKILETEGQLYDLIDYLSTLLGKDAVPFLKDQAFKLDLNYLKEQNLNKNLEIHQLSAQEFLAQKESEIAKGGNLPSIAGIASLGIRNGYVPRLNGETPAFSDDFRLNSVIGLKLNIPIYSGKRTEKQVEIAKINQERIQFQKTDTENKLLYAERSARNLLKTIIDRIKAQEQAVEQAKYAYQLAVERFKSGLIKKIELDQSESIFEEAQLLLVQFNYQAKKEEIELKKIIGETFWK